uniref:Uncharacterized protein n=1 Tax=Anguilla anguilla TaxID=7936 RepID=A0A0E9WP18_ANGAN
MANLRKEIGHFWMYLLCVPDYSFHSISTLSPPIPTIATLCTLTPDWPRFVHYLKHRGQSEISVLLVWL